LYPHPIPVAAARALDDHGGTCEVTYGSWTAEIAERWGIELTKKEALTV
jgi:hypothetical protein